jgi:hypothetical protein
MSYLSLKIVWKVLKLIIDPMRQGYHSEIHDSPLSYDSNSAKFRVDSKCAENKDTSSL